MSRNRPDDRHRLIGALVQIQMRYGKRFWEDDQDYVIRLAKALADDGYWLEWAPREPVTVESLFAASDALKSS